MNRSLIDQLNFYIHQKEISASTFVGRMVGDALHQEIETLRSAVATIERQSLRCVKKGKKTIKCDLESCIFNVDGYCRSSDADWNDGMCYMYINDVGVNTIFCRTGNCVHNCSGKCKAEYVEFFNGGNECRTFEESER